MTTIDRLERGRQTGVITEAQHGARCPKSSRRDRFSVLRRAQRAALHRRLFDRRRSRLDLPRLRHQPRRRRDPVDPRPADGRGVRLLLYQGGPDTPTTRSSRRLSAFDYVLYFACLVLSATLAFIEARFEVFHGWDTHLLIAALVFGVLAYRFDNRFVLSLALSTLAGCLGCAFDGFDTAVIRTRCACRRSCTARSCRHRHAVVSPGHQGRTSSTSTCSSPPT